MLILHESSDVSSNVRSKREAKAVGNTNCSGDLDVESCSGWSRCRDGSLDLKCHFDVNFSTKELLLPLWSFDASRSLEDIIGVVV